LEESVEVLGHLILFLMATVAMYGMLADKTGHDFVRAVVALPVVAMLWFGMGGILTTAVGYSVGTQLYLGVRLYLVWQRKNRDGN
jgi:hypothetical protein